MPTVEVYTTEMYHQHELAELGDAVEPLKVTYSTAPPQEGELLLINGHRWEIEFTTSLPQPAWDEQTLPRVAAIVNESTPSPDMLA